MSFERLDSVPIGEPFDNPFYGNRHEVDAVNERITPLWEAYVGGSVGCHFHFVIHVRGEFALHELYADFQVLLPQPRAVSETDYGPGNTVQAPALEGDELGRNKHWIEHPVFIPIGESFKDRKGVKGGDVSESRRAVRSIIGLRPLDVCPVSRRDFTVSVRASDAIALQLNRKLNQPAQFLGRRTPVVIEDELVGELVEGASQVVNDVPENHGNTTLPFIGHYHNPKNVVARIRIELGAQLDLVGFSRNDGFDLSFESVAMLPGPLNLAPHPAKVDGHSRLQKGGRLA